MSVKTYKPTTPSRRNMSSLGFEEIELYEDSATFLMMPELRPYMVFFRLQLT